MVPWTNPNGISIDSAVLAQLTVLTNRQTDRHTDNATAAFAAISRIDEQLYSAASAREKKTTKQYAMQHQNTTQHMLCYQACVYAMRPNSTNFVAEHEPTPVNRSWRG